MNFAARSSFIAAAFGCLCLSACYGTVGPTYASTTKFNEGGAGGLQVRIGLGDPSESSRFGGVEVITRVETGTAFARAGSGVGGLFLIRAANQKSWTPFVRPQFWLGNFGWSAEDRQWRQFGPALELGVMFLFDDDRRVRNLFEIGVRSEYELQLNGEDNSFIFTGFVAIGIGDSMRPRPRR